MKSLRNAIYILAAILSVVSFFLAYSATGPDGVTFLKDGESVVKVQVATLGIMFAWVVGIVTFLVSKEA